MNDRIISLIMQLLAEEWDFSLTQTDGEASLSIPIIDGTLTLSNDGTWNYE